MENELLKKGTFGNVMLGSWMKSNLFPEEFIEKTKPIDQSTYQSDRYLWTSYAS